MGLEQGGFFDASSKVDESLSWVSFVIFERSEMLTTAAGLRNVAADNRGFNCWFSSAPVFQWCCSTPQGSPGVGRNTFLSSPHLCFIIGFICDLFVTRDDPLMS